MLAQLRVLWDTHLGTCKHFFRKTHFLEKSVAKTHFLEKSVAKTHFLEKSVAKIHFLEKSVAKITCKLRANYVQIMCKLCAI